MSVGVGTHLGSLEITALLGRGGMGEVYRARDLKLKREVAIKILPDEFSRDPDRVSRFQREAEVLASLNHANMFASRRSALRPHSSRSEARQRENHAGRQGQGARLRTGQGSRKRSGQCATVE